jgi:hypothetical protein
LNSWGAEKSGMSGWKRYCSWTSMEPNKFPNLLSSIQRFAPGCCQFFYLPFSPGNRKLEIDIRTLDSASSPCTTRPWFRCKILFLDLWWFQSVLHIDKSIWWK